MKLIHGWVLGNLMDSGQLPTTITPIRVTLPLTATINWNYLFLSYWRSLQSWIHSICGCLHKINLNNIPSPWRKSSRRKFFLHLLCAISRNVLWFLGMELFLKMCLSEMSICCHFVLKVWPDFSIFYKLLTTLIEVFFWQWLRVSQIWRNKHKNLEGSLTWPFGKIIIVCSL